MQTLVKLGLIVVLLAGLGGCQSLYQSDWALIKEKDGVQFYTRPVVGSRIPEFKGVTTLPGTTQQMLDVLMDVSSYPQWVYQCKSAEVIETIDYDQILLYQVNKVPFLRSRDIILHGKIEASTGSKLLRVHLNARPNYCAGKDSAMCEEINQSKYLRVTKSVGSFEAQQLSDNAIEVTWEQHLEPGGLLPAWLVTSQLDNLVFKTFKGLENQISAKK